MSNYFSYTLAINCNGTLYISSTSNLVKRVLEHKNKATNKLVDDKIDIKKVSKHQYL